MTFEIYTVERAGRWQREWAGLSASRLDRGGEGKGEGRGTAGQEGAGRGH